MRTLDEVIEIASDWTNGFDEMSIEKQMLHYLKEYKNTGEYYKEAIGHVTEVIDHYEKMVADYLSVNNPPLSWEELRSMEDKPIWVEYDNHLSGRKRTKYKNWEVIDMIAEDLILVKGDYSYRKDEFGDVWQAFRKERE